MTYDEVMRRFGPPQMQITTGAASKSLAYDGVEVEVDDGKVIAVSRSAGSDQAGIAK